VVLGLAFLIVVSAGAWWHAFRCEAASSRLEDEERVVFRRLYPNVSVPPGVRRWMAAESTRLKGLSGGGMPDQPSALERLRLVTAGLPKDLRFRILDLRVEPTEVALDGQALSHADAETLARGIAKAGGFAVEAPRTENLPKGGVAFTIVAQPAAAKPVPATQGGKP
jgi:hypothetical protein